VTFLAVVLLLYGAFCFGWAQGRHPDPRVGFGALPWWVFIGFGAAVLGAGLVIGSTPD
jgi:hypothetical protein